MIFQQHKLADSAFANLSRSLITVAGLASPKLPRLPSKREWQGHTHLSFWEQLLRGESPWRPNELRAVDNALKEYSKARIRYERLADSNQQNFQKLIHSDTDSDTVIGTDIGGGCWQRKLNELLASKGRELRAYERAAEAAGVVSNRLDRWSQTQDHQFRGLEKTPVAMRKITDQVRLFKRPLAMGKLNDQVSSFNLEDSTAQLRSRRSKLTKATDRYQRAQRDFTSLRQAILGSFARSLLRLDLSGAMIDLMYSKPPDSLLQSTWQLRKPHDNPTLHAPTLQRSFTPRPIPSLPIPQSFTPPLPPPPFAFTPHRRSPTWTLPQVAVPAPHRREIPGLR